MLCNVFEGQSLYQILDTFLFPETETSTSFTTEDWATTVAGTTEDVPSRITTEADALSSQTASFETGSNTTERTKRVTSDNSAQKENLGNALLK